MSNHLWSSAPFFCRKIEKQAPKNLPSMVWLLAGQKAPDHSTIARFRTGFLASACEDLFYQLVRLFMSMGELSGETVFIDGTKLEACANKYTFVWKKSVGKWEEKMFTRLQDAVQMLNQEYIQSFVISKDYLTSPDNPE